jgi:hypothetical protein
MKATAIEERFGCPAGKSARSGVIKAKGLEHLDLVITSGGA